VRPLYQRLDHDPPLSFSRRTKNPSDAQIKDALTGIKCRCANSHGYCSRGQDRRCDDEVRGDTTMGKHERIVGDRSNTTTAVSRRNLLSGFGAGALVVNRRRYGWA